MAVVTTGSRTAGYVISVLLFIPLATLGLFVTGYVGAMCSLVALAVVGAAALEAWLVRGRAPSRRN